MGSDSPSNVSNVFLLVICRMAERYSRFKGERDDLRERRVVSVGDRGEVEVEVVGEAGAGGHAGAPAQPQQQAQPERRGLFPARRVKVGGGRPVGLAFPSRAWCGARARGRVRCPRA